MMTFQPLTGSSTSPRKQSTISLLLNSEWEKQMLGTYSLNLRLCDARCTQACPKWGSYLWSDQIACLRSEKKRPKSWGPLWKHIREIQDVSGGQGTEELSFFFFLASSDFWMVAMWFSSEKIQRINDKNLNGHSTSWQAVQYKSVDQPTSANNASQITSKSVLRQTTGRNRLTDYHSFLSAFIYL